MLDILFLFGFMVLFFVCMFLFMWGMSSAFEKDLKDMEKTHPNYIKYYNKKHKNK